MIKKLLTSIFVTFVCAAGVMAAASQSNELPTIELIKDHQVIQTRMMTNQEYEAYQQLTELEIQFDDLELPLEDLEDQMDAQAEKIELAVEIMIERQFAGRSNDSQAINDFEFEKDMALEQLTQLVAQLQPNLDKISAMANELQTAASIFKDTLQIGGQGQDFDSIRIIDSDDNSTMHFEASY